MAFRVRARMVAMAAAFACALGAGVSTAAPQASAAVSGGSNQTGYALAFQFYYNPTLQTSQCSWPTTPFNGGCGYGTTAAMAPNTSPSITTVGQSSYEEAFQGPTTCLWIAGALGTGCLGLGMMPGTSPSITALTAGGYEIAFQANTGVLWVAGSAGTGPLGTTMDPHSSPSIMATTQPSNGYEVAYQDANHNLEITGSLGAANLGLGMYPGTNPSIMYPRTGGYEIAFEANTTALWDTGNLDNGPTGWAMYPGTSPSISYAPPTTYWPNGGFEIGFLNSDGRLWGQGSLLAGPVRDPRFPNGIYPAPGSDPIVAGIIMPAYLGGGQAPSYEFFYQDNGRTLHAVIGSAFSTKYLDAAGGAGPINPGTIPAVASFAP